MKLTIDDQETEPRRFPEMTAEELKGLTKAFALRLIKLVDAMPRTLGGQVLGRQLLRSATSVGANYRAAGNLLIGEQTQ
jgi:hypothetical protein